MLTSPRNGHPNSDHYNGSVLSSTNGIAVSIAAGTLLIAPVLPSYSCRFIAGAAVSPRSLPASFPSTTANPSLLCAPSGPSLASSRDAWTTVPGGAPPGTAERTSRFFFGNWIAGVTHEPPAHAELTHALQVGNGNILYYRINI